MFRIGLALALFLLVTSSQIVYACGPSRITEENTNKTIDHAFFIGMVKTVEVDVIDNSLFNSRTKYVFEPIWAYTNPLEKPITAYKEGYSSCDKRPADKGAIFEAVIFKTDKGFQLGDQHDHALPWEQLREQAAKRNGKFLKLQKECQNFGGQIGSRNTGSRWQLECIGNKFYPSSDAGEKCNYNSECEGLCIVNPQSFIDKLIMRRLGKRLVLGDIKNTDFPHCSNHLSEKGCFYTASKAGSSIHSEENFLIKYQCVN